MNQSNLVYLLFFVIAVCSALALRIFRSWKVENREIKASKASLRKISDTSRLRLEISRARELAENKHKQAEYPETDSIALEDNYPVYDGFIYTGDARKIVSTIEGNIADLKRLHNVQRITKYRPLDI